MEDVGIFNGHLVQFTAIWSNLRPFGPIYGHLVYFVSIWYILWSFAIHIFPHFVMLYQKNLATLHQTLQTGFQRMVC
jgi:hypothetical protein